MSATFLLNLAKFKDREKLLKVVLDPKSGFFSVFDKEIQGDSHDKVMAILHVFQTLFSSIVEFHDEQSITVLETAFRAPFFESDVRAYLDFVQKIKNNVKKEHLIALQGYYYFLQNLDKACFTDKEVRIFLEQAFPVLYETRRCVRAAGANFDLKEPKERECQKPISDGRRMDTEEDQNAEYDFENYGSFREIPIFPTIEDIRGERENILFKNLVDHSYRNIDHYLATQFRLLREVVVRPLRESIEKIVSKRKNDPTCENFGNDRDLLIYHDVQFIGSEMANAGLMFKIKFDVKRIKGVNWEETSRLLPGSILCLSADSFDTVIFAAVAKRDEEMEKEGQLDIFFFLDANESVDYYTLIDGRKYIAVESVTYYEAFRHSLQALKDFNWRERFPFKKYIVDVFMEVDSPAYLKDDAVYNLSDLALAVSRKVKEDECTTAKRVIRASQLNEIQITKDSTQIPWDLMDLDESQFQAVHAALTREFVVIQGPPGTGKTYVALRIVQALLRNRDHWMKVEETRILPPAPVEVPAPQDGVTVPPANVVPSLPLTPSGRALPERTCPILILAYKNHALDQFLDGISRFVKFDKLIRVGGRSKHQIVKHIALYRKRKDFKLSENFNQVVPHNERKLYGTCLRKIEDITKEMEAIGLSAKHIKHGYRLAGLEILPSIKCMGTEDREKGKETKTKNIEKLITRFPEHAHTEQIELGLLRWLKLDRGIDEDDYKRITMEMINYFIQKSADDALPPDENREGADSGIDVDDNEDDDDDDEDVDENGVPSSLFRLRHRQIDPDEFEKNKDFRRNPLSSELFNNPQLRKSDLKRIPKDDARRRILEAGLFIREQLEKEDPKDVMNEEEANKIKDIEALKCEERWRLYRYWVKLYLADIRQDFRKMGKEIELYQKELARLRTRVDYYICRDAWVVGMTTTGAAKYRQLVELLKPKIVLVEEAAEILEGHIVSALTSYTEHLIMIGDHQQLRPIPGIEDLARNYKMDISLFERMVTNNMACYQLNKQHRMRPTISALLRPHIYKELYDHESVEDYEHIKFTKGKNVFFLSHKVYEDRKRGSHSCSNSYEAEFVVELARYFLLRGVDPDKITILTTYNAQLEKIKQWLLKYRDIFEKKWNSEQRREHREGKKPKPELAVRASTVDGFQGEENDIVIISFVRSSEECEIGFLRIPNRVCVALSRARKGLFCIGNFEAMEREPLWANIIGTLRENNAIGHELTLGCQCKQFKITNPQQLTIKNTLYIKNFKCNCTR